jgi:hypothetical protein
MKAFFICHDLLRAFAFTNFAKRHLKLRKPTLYQPFQPFDNVDIAKFWDERKLPEPLSFAECRT